MWRVVNLVTVAPSELFTILCKLKCEEEREREGGRKGEGEGGGRERERQTERVLAHIKC